MANELHYFLGGSRLGNAPLPLWASAHYNFGWTGIVATGLLLGCLCQALHVWFVRQPRRVSTTVLYSLFGIGLFTAVSPADFVLKGGVTLPAFFALICIARAIRAPRKPVEKPTRSEVWRSARMDC